ncbi:hypothetical protein ACTFIU_007453 [Dictyostelium citrinum]|jgi:glutaredoxin-like YruB-family protein
MILN